MSDCMDPLLPETTYGGHLSLVDPLKRKPGPWRGILAVLALIALSSLFTGCLYTTHHFNSGRILEPGQTAVTIGYGVARIYEQGCPDDWNRPVGDSNTTHCERYVENTPFSSVRDSVMIRQRVTSYPVPKLSLGYRLGVRGPWGPFTGVEMGWHLEAPTNPGTIEFDLKFGLPLPRPLIAKFHHSLTGGWGVGNWADNSWFLEYAASRDLGRHSFYGNYRYTRLATQAPEINESAEAWKFESQTGHSHQAALGFFLRLPDIFLIPDYVTPQAILTFPIKAPFVKVDSELMDPMLLNYNFGFGWNF